MAWSCNGGVVKVFGGFKSVGLSGFKLVCCHGSVLVMGLLPWVVAVGEFWSWVC